MALFLCIVSSFFWPIAAVAAPGMVAVTASSATLRQSAADTATVVKTIYKGEVVKVTAVSGLWYKVSTSAGISGWCKAASFAAAVYSSPGVAGNTTSLDWPSETIDLAKSFSYQRCMQNMTSIAAAYPTRARIVTIGKTTMGNAINAIVLGNPKASKRILLQSAMHAREWLTALVALRQAECLLKDASFGGVYKNVSIAGMLDNVEVWIVPEANPDGVRLVFEGLAAVPSTMPQLAASIKAMNKGSTDFRRWKANARGVDLNRNFDAYWQTDPAYPKPGPYNYAGTKPFTEPESIALRDLTVSKDFDLTLSYHSSGEIIYWYDNIGPNTLNLYLANKIGTMTGYKVLSIAAQGPGSGYRDWYQKIYHRPAYTIEIASGYCPLPQSTFTSCWPLNRYVLLEMLWTVAPKSLTALAK